MVTTNPLFAGGRSVSSKLLSTVVIDIWPEILFLTLVATMVTLVSELTPHSLAVSNQMLTVLGTVVGLVISFRTSTAYERYAEGRKLWTNIAINSRTLAEIIWIHAPFERKDKETGEAKSLLRVVVEKKSMINLVQAYSVSVKHLLRGEGGVYYTDLYPLVSFLPRFNTPADHAAEEDILPLWKASDMDHEAYKTLRSKTGMSKAAPSTPLGEIFEVQRKDVDDAENRYAPKSKHSKHHAFDPESALPDLPSERPLLPAKNPPRWKLSDFLDVAAIFKPITALFGRARQETLPSTKSARGRTFTGKKIRPPAADSNVPVEIALFLTTYFASLMRQGLLTPSSASAMVNAITALQDSVVNLERIKTTPLPFAYQAHLRMSLWLYLFFLPFQIYNAFGWLTIPATAFASLLFIGFLEIGQEIENPFDYDLNCLDLDHFCLAIERELHEVTAHPCPDPDSYVFTEWNQPFAPADRRSAREMQADAHHSYNAKETGVHSIRQTLLKNWQSVNEMTRE